MRRPGLGRAGGVKKRPKNLAEGVGMYAVRRACHVSVARASLRALSHVGSRFAAHGRGIPYDALVGGARPSRSVGGAGAVYLTYLLTYIITQRRTRLGWLHVDVHPGNVMCNKKGKMLFDRFGLGCAQR